MKWPWSFAQKTPPTDAARAVAEAIETEPLVSGSVLDATGISKFAVLSRNGQMIEVTLFSNRLNYGMSSLRINGVSAFTRTPDTDFIAGAALRRANKEFERAMQSVLGAP